MKSLLPLAFYAIALILSTTHAQAAEPNKDQPLVKKINTAIDQGVAYFRLTRHPERFWDDGWTTNLTGFKGGPTALVVLAMLNSGVKSTDKDVAKALEYLKEIKPTRTYVVALSTMAFADAHQEKYQKAIEENVEWLLKTAKREKGVQKGWGYPGTMSDEWVDASNTQFALLALYAAKQAGVKIEEKHWKDIRDLYLRTKIDEEKTSAFWTYHDQARSASFTMTVAGVCGLTIARMGLNQSPQKLDDKTGVAGKCGEYPENEAIRMGLFWISEQFRFENAKNSFSTFYNVYGIERLGRITGERLIGKHNWYREGCDYLLKSQSADGSWSQRKKFEEGNDEGDGSKAIATSFSLLFLAKGRTPLLVSKLSYGDADIKIRSVLEKNIDTLGAVGWNRKNNDIRNVADYCSRELFKNAPMGWQNFDMRYHGERFTFDLNETVEDLLQSPILYINGHDAPRLTVNEKKVIKKYIENGGFVLAEACCGKPKFAEGMRDLVKELKLQYECKPLSSEHAVWKSHFTVPPEEFKKLEGVDHNNRTVMILSPEPLAGYWEESRFMPEPGKKAENRGQQAYNLAANIVAYATQMQPPKQRLTQYTIPKE